MVTALFYSRRLGSYGRPCSGLRICNSKRINKIIQTRKGGSSMVTGLMIAAGITVIGTVIYIFG